MVLTTEKQEIILNNMEDLLERFDYEYTRSALISIVNKWWFNKRGLLDLLSNHPNYDPDQYAIVFDTDYEREIDGDEVHEFQNYMLSTLCDLNVDNRWSAISFTAERVISEGYANILNKFWPDVHAHAGQKTTRVVNKLCKILGVDKPIVPNPTEEEIKSAEREYNQRFARFADAMSPIKIKRHTIISLNPLDYLTMSFGNSWSSCHTIDKENKRGVGGDSYHGCRSSGTVSYMLDSTSIVLYTVDGAYNGREFWNQPKINRQMFHYDNGILVQGRLYPQCNDGKGSLYEPYRNLMQEIIAGLEEKPNLWNLHRGTEVCDKYIYSYGTHYRDYSNFDDCNVSVMKDAAECEKTIDIGHDPICIFCGSEHETEENISCCYDRHRCSKCGAIHDEEDMRNINGEWYCEDCTYYCVACGEFHVGTPDTEPDSDDHYVCIDRIDDYEICDDCGGYRPKNTMKEIDGLRICPRCYTTCSHCGQITRYRVTTYHNSSYFCSDCAKMFEQCAACGMLYMPKENDSGICPSCEQRIRRVTEFHDYLDRLGVVIGSKVTYLRHGQGGTAKVVSIDDSDQTVAIHDEFNARRFWATMENIIERVD